MKDEKARNLVRMDCGCGDKKVIQECIGVDIRRTEATDVIAHVVFLPFKAKSVDVVFARSLLEHFHNPYGVLDEVHRILKPSGVMMAWLPNPSSCSANLAQQHKAGHKFLGDYWLWKRILDGFFKHVKGVGLGVKFRSCPTYFKLIQHVLVRFGFYDFAYDLFFVCKNTREAVSYNYPIWWAEKAEIDKDSCLTLKNVGRQ